MSVQLVIIHVIHFTFIFLFLLLAYLEYGIGQLNFVQKTSKTHKIELNTKQIILTSRILYKSPNQIMKICGIYEQTIGSITGENQDLQPK